MRILGFFAVVLSAAFMSCEGTEGSQVQMDQVQKFQDSLPTVVSSISSIQTRVDESQNVKVILGSAKLYDAPAERKQEVAIIAGNMALGVFGRGIKNGTLILTKEIKDHKEDPADGIKTDMKIDSLKTATAPAQ